MAKPHKTAMIAAPPDRVTIETPAPSRRLQATYSQAIQKRKMAIVRGVQVWIGKVRPVDSRHVMFKRQGRTYILKEGEFQLLALNKS